MDEELKKIKQLKAREETTMRTTLPWRLRIFGMLQNVFLKILDASSNASSACLQTNFQLDLKWCSCVK